MIRPYQVADLEALLDVWTRSARDAYTFLDERFFVEERGAIREEWLPRAETWVYEADGRVAGFLSLVGDQVGAIFVDPACQGRGVGRALMDHACTLRDTLELDVFKRNAKGRRFYARYGFRWVREHVHAPTGEAQLRLRFRAVR